MNELFFVVALVTMLQGGQDVGTATGFFYAKDNTSYFVTNRHVVIDEKKGLKADALRVRLHADQHDLTKNVDRVMPLYQDGRPRWHVHKDYPRVPIDIAVIEYDRKLLLQGTVIRTLHKKSIYAKERSVFAPGDDIIVLGFPRGVSDITHNLALMRNALIASPYGINFGGRPMFLVDANLHPGMSGSPVMTKPRTWVPIEKGGVSIYQTPVSSFLGVFSATLSAVIPVKAEKKEEQGVKEEALGLGAVWYAELVEEIIDNIRK
jgi:hypothetical protein